MLNKIMNLNFTNICKLIINVIHIFYRYVINVILQKILFKLLINIVIHFKDIV
jgi:hypothetical protein